MGINFSRMFGLATNLHISLVHPRAFFRFGIGYDKKDLVGAEIGTWTGENAEGFLKKLDIKKIYLIDPYIDEEYFEKGEFGEIPLNNAENDAFTRLVRWDEKIEWIKKPSDDAVEKIKEKLDFVYIDGNHRYDFVKRDIENYWKLIKVGGVLGGHDIEMISVAKAVTEFSHNNEIDLHIKNGDWWVYKK